MLEAQMVSAPPRGVGKLAEVAKSTDAGNLTYSPLGREINWPLFATNQKEKIHQCQWLQIRSTVSPGCEGVVKPIINSKGHTKDIVAWRSKLGHIISWLRVITTPLDMH